MGVSLVHVHIQELVLHGFPPGNYGGLGAAVEAELTRLFLQRGLPQGLTNQRNTAHADGGAFDVAGGTGPEAIGSQVARAVYRGLGG